MAETVTENRDEDGFVPLFDGVSLSGWHPAPRVYGSLYPGGPSVHETLIQVGRAVPVEPENHPALWRVEDGVLIGEQDAPGSGYGGYLVSDKTYGDFELVLEMRPDWPADTGVMLRRLRDSWEGFQVLVDHRPSGGIAGFFGNGLANFSAVPFAIDVARDDDGNPIGLVADNPETSVEPVTAEKRSRLSYAGDVDDFLNVWRWNDWNELRIRCVGKMPVITTWINGLKIAELDTAALQSPNYDADAVYQVLGNRGHIALEVHDNDEMFGEARWGVGAQCRWRNIRIKEFPAGTVSDEREGEGFRRVLKPGQRCEVWVASVATGSRDLVFATDNLLFEAPNWTADGSGLILNGAGTLWRLDLASGSIEEVPLAGIPEINNDHVLAPDGEQIYLSANDGHIYRASLHGGAAMRITEDDDGTFHFLHGVSPDGKELAYVGIEAGDFTQPGRLMTIASDGGHTERVDVGPGHCDGPEYSPDGKWLYLNTESFTAAPGHAQLARIRTDGSEFEQLLESDTVDWFPHLSPDGRYATYIRFPSGTEGHPADLPVTVVLVSTEDWTTPLHTWPLFGGQGTLNVNSWAPDSTRFAYVAYPITSSEQAGPGNGRLIPKQEKM